LIASNGLEVLPFIMHHNIIKKINGQFFVSGFLGIVIGAGTVGAVTPMVSVGPGHSLILKTDGTLWACG
jgi:alpha-tubulin suppressor-like RCC1 family protein